ncbi:MAG: hypothetical protein WCO06_02360 [Candidatus Roizmanbacteria bacterium]
MSDILSFIFRGIILLSIPTAIILIPLQLLKFFKKESVLVKVILVIILTPVLVGLFFIAGTMLLALITTFEQNTNICFGISCRINF